MTPLSWLNEPLVMGTSLILDLMELRILPLCNSLFPSIYVPYTIMDNDDLKVLEIDKVLEYKIIPIKTTEGYELLGNLKKNYKTISEVERISLVVSFENDFVCGTSHGLVYQACKSLDIRTVKINEIVLYCCSNKLFDNKQLEYISSQMLERKFCRCLSEEEKLGFTLFTDNELIANN